MAHRLKANQAAILQTPLFSPLTRRQMLAASLSAPLWPGLLQAQSVNLLQFPRDLGSHPDHAIEWWYLTGQLYAGSRVFGFQLTFFRSRVPTTQTMTSSFAAKQLIFAHAAITDVTRKRLWQTQRIARVSGNRQLDLAFASTQDTEVQLGDWSLKHHAATYQAHASGADFSMQLSLHETQALLLQGAQGWSRKGPDPAQASYYYTLPQLNANGELQLKGQTFQVQGNAWLDHEWSQSLLPSDAVGWDWIGINLQDGSALTAFRLRSQTGHAIWAGGSFRAKGQTLTDILGPNDVRFTPIRHWISPASHATYPVVWAVDLTRPNTSGQPGTTRYIVQAMVDNQELDSSQSTGAFYWEGLSELLDDQGHLVGHGYLEMTGYVSPLKF